MNDRIILFILFNILLGFFNSISAQPMIIPDSAPKLNLNEQLQRKIVSNKLVSDIRLGMMNNISGVNINGEVAEEEKIGVVIYFENYPSNNQISELEELGIVCFVDTWIPPLTNHPYGFILAKMPLSKLDQTLSKAFIKKMDSSTHQHQPNNNMGTFDMMANHVWLEGFDGTGVKVAVLDSGIDDFYEGTDFPTGFEKMDYSGVPDIAPDTDVANSKTGHGTHVAGSVLGRGNLSSSNTGNGGGAYKGVAPGADLVFLKIGNDVNGSASYAAEIAAMQAAVNIYNADILTMSYGGWTDHHDGSSSVEQTVDWVYSMGKPFFIAAGNSAEESRHYSGTIGPNTSSNFIQVNVSGGLLLGNYNLFFNLVWVDGVIGTGSTDLDLQLYSSSYSPITTKSNGGQTESNRGTESEYFYYDNFFLFDGTYYIKVINNSSSTEKFHIYEVTNSSAVKFNNPDPFYTIGQPASADNAFAVGAHTTRSSWTDYDGDVWTFGNPQDDIAPFSSLGPRVDEVMKPNLTAPGSIIISLRDTDVLTVDNEFTIDNDGTLGSGSKNYYGMQGTSMACPLAAGAAALYLQYNPSATPQEVYDALQNNATTDGLTGSVPNSTFGYGKLNIYEAIFGDKVDLEIAIYLEGPYNGGTSSMSSSLTSELPTTQPFNVTPWFYNGSETLDPIPSTYTDWVLIELRTDQFTSNSLYRKAALVNSTGGIYEFNGNPLKITAPPGDYWIVVHHRNHLSVMSSSTVNLTKVTPPTPPTISLSYENGNKSTILN